MDHPIRLDQVELAVRPWRTATLVVAAVAAVELVQDKTTKAEYPKEDQIGIKVHAATQKRGVFSRLRGDVFCLAPPIVISEPQLDRIVDALHESIVEVLGK